jgi:predicted metalloprotease
MRIRIIVVLTFLILGSIPLQAQGQDDDWDLQELLELAALDINDYWVRVFADNNIQYTQPEIVLFTNRRIRTGCGVVRSRTGPFYCPRDHTIYLTYSFMQDYLDNVGDFAVVLILAHEWGHAVQAQVGELRGLSITRELQADCYAGSWARHAANTSEMVELSPGDLEEGATMLFLVGDRNSDWFAENAHGTSDQRIEAYNVGLEQDYPGCEVNP